ncbi:PBECR2 nuclease fold domain-containing protein [Geobacillus thermoleovorans]|uniref:PBECR2 nuclease fold domain-containing protein n=1 Tax=Geobacillus thermoleovorans TaxID=33941 RepID=UPI00345C448D
MFVPKRNDSNRPYLWVTKNPLDTEVALTVETYESHIIGDHQNDLSRELVLPYVKGVIEQPRFIYCDKDYEKNKRVRYTDQVYLEQFGKIQNLVIIVDTDRYPNEIVTWMVKSNTKQEIIKGKGGLIYDSRAKDNK